MSKLIECIRHLDRSDEYPLHMPGHKRNMEDSFLSSAYQIDITEIEGYDNLYEAESILKDAMDRTARVFGAKKSWFLVNGSTVGILTAITALTHKGGHILIARNCHKSVYHACELRDLQIDYLYPITNLEWDFAGEICPAQVEEALDKWPDIEAIVITSPTYEGMVSDIEQISQIAHQRNIPLIVDEAHGAHFSFHKRFPVSSIQLGADVVIQSLHKTLPAFTQTALLHCNVEGEQLERIEKYLGFYQTSSPSYVLMSGMDECVETIEKQGSHLWDTFFTMRDEFLEKCKSLTKIRIYSGERENGGDPCKIVISVRNTGMTGTELQKILLDTYHIQVEMTNVSYVLGIITMNDTKEGFDRLYQALSEIDEELVKVTNRTKETIETKENTLVETVYNIGQVCDMPKKRVLLQSAIGKVAAEFVNIYPPGIPLLVPGERITEDIIALIHKDMEANLHVQGIEQNTIEVIDE